MPSKLVQKWCRVTQHKQGIFDTAIPFLHGHTEETTKVQKMAKQHSYCAFANNTSEHVPRELQRSGACDIKPYKRSHYYPEVEKQTLKRGHRGVEGGGIWCQLLSEGLFFFFFFNLQKSWRRIKFLTFRFTFHTHTCALKRSEKHQRSKSWSKTDNIDDIWAMWICQGWCHCW